MLTRSMTPPPTPQLPPRLRTPQRLVFYCRTINASIAPFTSRRMCCPTHCASYCSPCQPLLFFALYDPTANATATAAPAATEEPGTSAPPPFLPDPDRPVFGLRANGPPNPPESSADSTPQRQRNPVQGPHWSFALEGFGARSSRHSSNQIETAGWDPCHRVQPKLLNHRSPKLNPNAKQAPRKTAPSSTRLSRAGRAERTRPLPNRLRALRDVRGEPG